MSFAAPRILSASMSDYELIMYSDERASIGLTASISIPMVPSNLILDNKPLKQATRPLTLVQVGDR